MKADEGEFYIIKHTKPEDQIKSIIKKSKNEENVDEDEGRATVFFNLQDNEIRDFLKNSKLPMGSAPRQEKKKFKKEKKQKGKGKNRRKNQKNMEDRELQKIQKAERKRREREGIEEAGSEEGDNKNIPFGDLESQEVDLDHQMNDDDENEQEACNAPSTRKSNSVPLDFGRSPFAGDDLLMFSRDDKDDEDEDEQEEEIKETVDKEEGGWLESKHASSLAYQLEIPTKSAQLERDLRSLKYSLKDQREYLMRIDPENLKSIFRASIEIETILAIVNAFNSSTEKWLNIHSEYLISFLHNLIKVDRFSMSVEF